MIVPTTRPSEKIEGKQEFKTEVFGNAMPLIYLEMFAQEERVRVTFTFRTSGTGPENFPFRKKTMNLFSRLCSKTFPNRYYKPNEEYPWALIVCRPRKRKKYNTPASRRTRNQRVYRYRKRKKAENWL